MSKKNFRLPVLTVGPRGVLTVTGFAPRTFGEACREELSKRWAEKPEKLAKSLRKCPDLLSAVIALMATYEEYLWEQRAEAEQELGKAAESEKEMLSEELAFLDSRLESLASLSPAQWVESLSPIEYLPMAESVREFLDSPVDSQFVAFSPVLDTAEGAAAHALRQLPVEILQALRITFRIGKGASCPLTAVTKLSAEKIQEAASQMGLDAAFTKASGDPAASEPAFPKTAPAELAPIVPAPEAEKKPEPKAPARRPAARKAAPAKKPAAKKAPAKTAVKTEAVKAPAAKAAPARKAPAANSVTEKAPVAEKSAEKAPAAKPAVKAPAKKPTAKKTAAEKKPAAVKKAAAAKKPAAPRKTAAKTAAKAPAAKAAPKAAPKKAAEKPSA